MAEVEVWDDWEDMEDSGELDKRLEQEKKIEEKVVNQTPIPVITEDTHRTAYQPQLRILKRENASGDQSSSNNTDASGKNKAKTLAEREAAYAEARLRILGSAKSEEDTEESRPAEEPSPPVLMRKSPSKSPEPQTASR